MAKEYEKLHAMGKEAEQSLLETIAAGEQDGTTILDREALLPAWQKAGASGDGGHSAGECYAFERNYFVIEEANNHGSAEYSRGWEAT